MSTKRKPAAAAKTARASKRAFGIVKEEYVDKLRALVSKRSEKRSRKK